MVNVSEIMTTKLITVGPDTPLKDVVERMIGAEVSSLPVTDDSGKLLGLVTEADLIAKVAYTGVRHRALALVADVISGREHHWVAKAAGCVAADLMSANVVSCGPDDTATAAARRMLEQGVKHMPVLDGDRIVGMVSRRDVLAMFDRPDEAIACDVERALVHDPSIPDDHHVRSSVEAGIVTLSGDVRFGWDVPIVVSIVRHVPGVIDVVDHLHHREANPPGMPPRWMI